MSCGQNLTCTGVTGFRQASDACGLSDCRTLAGCRNNCRNCRTSCRSVGRWTSILTEQTLADTVGRLSDSCRTVGLSDCRTVGKLSDTVGIHCRTVGPGLSRWSASLAYRLDRHPALTGMAPHRGVPLLQVRCGGGRFVPQVGPNLVLASSYYCVKSASSHLVFC